MAEGEMDLHPLPARLSRVERPAIHFTELPEAAIDSPIAREWNAYRQQVGRLLAEGQQDRWVLIQGQEIAGIWDAEHEANEVRQQRFPAQSALVQQIREWEPVLRCGAYYRPWPS